MAMAGAPMQADKGAYMQDIVHLLQRYAAGVEELLQDNVRKDVGGRDPVATASVAMVNTAGKGSPRGAARRGGSAEAVVTGAGRAATLSTAAREVLELKQQDDATRVARSCEKYRALLAKENARWILGRGELVDAYLEARRRELETLQRHYTEAGTARIAAFAQERLEGHLAELRPVEDQAGDREVAQAREEWSGEVCTSVVQDLRLEWRESQRRILGGLAKETRHEHAAIGDVLDKQIKAWEQLSRVSEAAWSAELQRAREQLDRLAQGYKKALQVLSEAELREMRTHVAEQAEFFQNDILEAQKAEELQDARSSAQIRRMRLAVLKWQHDYLRDARLRAAEAAQRSTSSRAAALPYRGAHAEVNGEEPGDAPQRLADARHALDQVHASSLVGSQAEVREFLLRLEQASPATAEVLQLYEDHLSEHGILAPLGVAAARAPPATLAAQEEAPAPTRATGARGALARGKGAGRGRAGRGGSSSGGGGLGASRPVSRPGTAASSRPGRRVVAAA